MVISSSFFIHLDVYIYYEPFYVLKKFYYNIIASELLPRWTFKSWNFLLNISSQFHFSYALTSSNHTLFFLILYLIPSSLFENIQNKQSLFLGCCELRVEYIFLKDITISMINHRIKLQFDWKISLKKIEL